MKKFFLSTSLLATLSLSLIADTVMSTSEVDSDYQNFPGRAGSNDVFAGAPYPKNSCNLELFGEFLWMDSGFDTVTTMSGNAWQTNPQDFHRNFDGFATHYQPAFRLGLGYQFEQQGWDLVGSYLYFKNNKSRSTDRPYYGFDEKEDWGGWLAPVVVWWPSDIQTSKYNLSYNQGDLSFAKEIFFTKYYSLKPSIGPRYVSAQYGFKNLAANVSNTDQPPLSNASVEMSNNMNLFGFNFGFENKFLFGQGIYLLGSLNTGLGYAWTDIDYVAKYFHPEQESFSELSRSTHAKMKSRNIIPFLDARMDLGWERSFNDESWALKIYAGYDFHVLVNAFNIIYFSIMGSVDPETVSPITTTPNQWEFNPLTSSTS